MTKTFHANLFSGKPEVLLKNALQNNTKDGRTCICFGSECVPTFARVMNGLVGFEEIY